MGYVGCEGNGCVCERVRGLLRVCAHVSHAGLQIGTKYHNSITGESVPVIHFSAAVPPLVLCVTLNRTDGEFERNVASLGLTEGVDVWQFA